jgi:2-phosphosulfolactate phosphatase
MRLHRIDFQARREVRGTGVVIDVLRAFTSAAYALASGADELWLASSIGEARRWQGVFPHVVLAGGFAGTVPHGFDFGNSPSELERADLRGRTVVLVAGEGVASSAIAARRGPAYAASFVCAGATATKLRAEHPDDVTFVVSGAHRGWSGDEDTACADYLSLLTIGESVSPRQFLDRVVNSLPARNRLTPTHPEYAPMDLEMALRVSRFDFAMRLSPLGERVILRMEH